MKLNAILLAFTLLIANYAHAQQDLPEGLAQFKPMPLPRPGQPIDPTNHDLKAVYHNLLTGETETYFLPESTEHSENLLKTIRGFDPSAPEQVPTGSTGNQQNYYFTNLSPADQISGFPDYPFSTIVKLYLTTYSPNSGYQSSTCSGAMIGPRHAITAGHCVADPQTGAQLIQSNQSVAVPAYNLGNAPFGSANIVGWWSFTQWVNNGNYDYDIAIVELSYNIGLNIGWLGFGYETNVNWFTSSSNDFKSIGYPAQDDFGNQVFEGGERMYVMNGFFDWTEFGYSNVLCHNNIGFHGQSGSGFYFKNSLNDRYVYGVLSHGNGTSAPYYTCHCKMDQFVFDFFLSKIAPTVDIEIPAQQQNAILIYPNPTNGLLSLDLPPSLASQKVAVSISDAFGKLVYSGTIQQESQPKVDLSASPAGVYWLSLSTSDETLSVKVLKD